jgi:hypothetical protein
MHHIRTKKGRNAQNHLNLCRKALSRVYNLFTIKTLRKLESERYFLNKKKSTYKNPS